MRGRLMVMVFFVAGGVLLRERRFEALSSTEESFSGLPFWRFRFFYYKKSETLCVSIVTTKDFKKERASLPFQGFRRTAQISPPNPRQPTQEHSNSCFLSSHVQPFA